MMVFRMILKTTNRMTVLVAIALLLAGSTALAQSGDGYDLTWWTVDGGGASGDAGGNGYTLDGAIGQPDAGALTGNDYTLVGGFWHGGVALDQHIYLPLMLRDF